MGEATEAAVKLAAEHGVSLTEVAGTGSDGRVTKDDVEAYLAGQAEASEQESLLAAPPALHGEPLEEPVETKPVSPPGHPYRPKTWAG